MALGEEGPPGILAFMGYMIKPKIMVGGPNCEQLGYIDQATSAVAETNLSEAGVGRLALSQKLFLKLLRRNLNVA